MLIKSICPQCGAQMEVDDSRDTFFCTYCGTRVENVAQKVEVSGTVHHVIDRSNEPNLIINYASCDQSVLMVTRIVSTGQKNTYINGQTSTFHLPQGAQTIVLKIGRINYERQIYIPRDNSPVRINASYTGHANISIDQPKWTAEETEQANAAIAVKPASALSIIAFILSFLVYTSPIALGLGIFDLAKGDKEKKHKLSIAAIIIGAILTIGLLSNISSCSSKNTTTTVNDSKLVATVDKTETVSEITKDSKLTTLATPELTFEPTAIPKPTPEPREPILVYEDEKVKISFKKLTSKGVAFEVENCTDANITIQADSISINKRSINDITMSEDIAPRSTGEIIAKCSVDPTVSVATVGGQLRIIDFNKSFQTYDASFVNVVVNDDVATLLPSNGDYVLLYEDDKIRIYYKELKQKGVVFEVENLTDVNITIQADSISINKRSINDITMSEDIAPQSTGEVIAKCSVDSTVPVATVGGQLRIIDFSKSFQTYDASFVNVVVNESIISEIVTEEQENNNAYTILFEDNKVHIYFKELTQQGVVFIIENLTDTNITIQADSISINKQSIDNITMSEDVAPQSKGEIIAKCDVDEATIIETVGGKLRIIDFNKSFKTYSASFVNVPIQ